MSEDQSGIVSQLLGHWAGGDEKALADLQNSEQDPLTLDTKGKLARLHKQPPDPALAKARAINAGCVESDDFRLKPGKKPAPPD